MEKNSIFTNALNLLRVSCLAITLIGVLACMLASFSPQTIEKLDEWLSKTYISSYRSRFLEATEKIDSDPATSLKPLLDLMDDMAEIKPQDRLALIKRDLYSSLILAYFNRKEYRQAIHWADEWVEFDERDLVAKVMKGQLLYEVPGRKEEGKMLLQKLFHRFPDVKVVSDNYAKVMETENQ